MSESDEIDYPLPGRMLRPLFLLAERHEAVYRLTLPLWWARWHYLHWRGIAA